MKSKLLLSALIVPALQGCMSGSVETSRDSLPCGEPPASWAGGYQRTGWRDEGRGYISNTESSASDTPMESIGDPPSARVLYCPTGQGTWISGKNESRLSAFEFLDLVRAENGFATDLLVKARSYKLEARGTVAGEASEIAACGCMAHYPEMDLPWTKRDD